MLAVTRQDKNSLENDASGRLMPNNLIDSLVENGLHIRSEHNRL